MLYIETLTGEQEVWYVGQRAPQITAGAVIEVQADGHELEYIRDHFTGIPMTDTVRIMNWYGDHAKFIANNLK